MSRRRKNLHMKRRKPAHINPRRVDGRTVDIAMMVVDADPPLDVCMEPGWCPEHGWSDGCPAPARTWIELMGKPEPALCDEHALLCVKTVFGRAAPHIVDQMRQWLAGDRTEGFKVVAGQAPGARPVRHS